MRQRILAAFLAMCMICCLTACGGSGSASSGGSGTGSQAGGGTDQTKDTGLFSVKGGWKDSDGNVIFFDAGGKGWALSKVTVPSDEVKFVETFEIPRAELEPGRSIRISKSQIPDSDKIRLRTDDIVFLDSPEEVAETVDPEGYEKEKWALEDADDEVTSAVKNAINGYQWEVKVDKFNYVIEFWEPDNYELRTSVKPHTT